MAWSLGVTRARDSDALEVIFQLSTLPKQVNAYGQVYFTTLPSLLQNRPFTPPVPCPNSQTMSSARAPHQPSHQHQHHHASPTPSRRTTTPGQPSMNPGYIRHPCRG